MTQIASTLCIGCNHRISVPYDPLAWQFNVENENWAKNLGGLIHRLHIAKDPFCKHKRFEVAFNHAGSSFIYEDPQSVENNLVVAERAENKLILWLRNATTN